MTEEILNYLGSHSPWADASVYHCPGLAWCCQSQQQSQKRLPVQPFVQGNHPWRDNLKVRTILDESFHKKHNYVHKCMHVVYLIIWISILVDCLPELWGHGSLQCLHPAPQHSGFLPLSLWKLFVSLFNNSHLVVEQFTVHCLASIIPERFCFDSLWDSTDCIIAQVLHNILHSDFNLNWTMWQTDYNQQ